MRSKKTFIMTLSLLMTVLFVGNIFTPAIASDISLASDSADRYPEEQSSSLAEDPFDPIDDTATPEEEPVHESTDLEGQAEEEVCLPCQVEPLEAEDMDDSEETRGGTNQEPGCPTCVEIINEAWVYAMEKADLGLDIDPEEFEGMGLIEKILYLRFELRKPFKSFVKYFGGALIEKLDDLPFSIFEAIAGSGFIFAREGIKLFLEYGFQPGLITIEALGKVKEYILDLCDGIENEGQTILVLPATQPVATQQTATQETTTQTTVVETVAVGITQTGAMSI